MILLRASVPSLVLLVLSLSVVAAPPFTNADLNGEYLVNVAHIRTEWMAGAPSTNYCDIAGTASFDGIGMVTVKVTHRCNVTGITTDKAEMHYTVNPDGSFLIDENPGFPDPVHGEIVNGGVGLLLDGTTRTNPNILMFHGVAMRR